MFEEDSIKTNTMVLMYDDFEGEEFTLTEKEKMEETTVTDEGDYYNICIDDDGDEECDLIA